MNIMMKRPLRQLAVALLLLGSVPAFATAEMGTAPNAAEVSAPTDVAMTAYKEAVQPEPCHYGVCQETSIDEPKVETVVGSDALPGFNSPALNPTVEAEDGC